MTFAKPIAHPEKSNGSSIQMLWDQEPSDSTDILLWIYIILHYKYIVQLMIFFFVYICIDVHIVQVLIANVHFADILDLN